MLGAIAGDIIGSVYERTNIGTTEFPLFSPQSRFTDDTVLTVALADSILHEVSYLLLLKTYFRRYPYAGYGGTFIRWAYSFDMAPYGSWGNGSAMRVSPIGWVAETLEEALLGAEQSAKVTHNHPEGIKGAQAIAAAIFLARTGGDKAAIRSYIEQTFGYDLSDTVENLQQTYQFDVSCQGSVPQAVIAFLESTDYEDAVRKAVSIGGDADTIACMCGGIAEAFYGGVPEEIAAKTYARLDPFLTDVTREFTERFCRRNTNGL